MAHIRIIVIAGQRTLGEALAARLAAEKGLTVVAAVDSVDSARRILVGRGADVVVLDADLSVRDAALLAGTSTDAADTAGAGPGRGRPRVVMLGTPGDPRRIIDAVRYGADAWVRKDESAQHLIGVVHGVMRGETWVPPVDLAPVLRMLLDGRDAREAHQKLLARLTARELEVLAHLADGASRQRIADQMQVSSNTVRSHLQNLMGKLGIHSTLEAAAFARRVGLGHHPDPPWWDGTVSGEPRP